MKGFIDFIRTQGVVGLAVGFILGGAISTFVKSIVEDIVNPVLGIALGKASGLMSASTTVAGATIKYGSFINSLINLLVIAAVVYFGVKALGIEKLDKKKE